jgi:hypothetical protein
MTVSQHRFWPGNSVTIGGLRTKVKSARLLTTDQSVKVQQEEFRVALTGLPDQVPDKLVTIFAVECESEPVQDMAHAFSVLAPIVRLAMRAARCWKIFIDCPAIVRHEFVGSNPRESQPGRPRRSSCATETIRTGFHDLQQVTVLHAYPLG